MDIIGSPGLIMKEFIGYSLNKDNTLAEIYINTQEQCPNTPQPVFFDHVIVHEINTEYSLLIDSFRNNINIIKNDIVEKLKNGSISNNPSMLKYFFSTYNKDYRTEKKKYEKYVIEKSFEATTSYVISPTYSCNNRCIYCYQQYDKSLDRGIISDKHLENIFSFIKNDMHEVRKKNSNHFFNLELFGGECFQAETKNQVKSVFEFARQNSMLVSATTNLVDAHQFLNIFATYKNYIVAIFTTIDGGKDYHNSRRRSLKVKDNYSIIVKNINTLIKLGIHTNVMINFDKHNFNQLDEFMELASTNNWINNKHITFQFGRVDDRLYDSNRTTMFTEAELLHNLIEYNKKHRFPANVRFAFIKSCLKLAERFQLSFNQNEFGRLDNHFCWSTSPYHRVFYIDKNLDVYRCAYSAGKTKYKTGNLSTNNDKVNEWFKHNIFNNEKCWNCSIGGFCSGGCYLSASVDKGKNKRCLEEKENVEYFIKEVTLPLIKKQFSL